MCTPIGWFVCKIKTDARRPKPGPRDSIQIPLTGGRMLTASVVIPVFLVGSWNEVVELKIQPRHSYMAHKCLSQVGCL